MIAITTHLPPISIQRRLTPFGQTHEEAIVREVIAGDGARAVGFEIVLVHHIQAMLVAQVEPAGVRWIVGGAHHVDVALPVFYPSRSPAVGWVGKTAPQGR